MNFLTIIMLGFSILGGIDRILGNRFGLGERFEKGFLLLGNLALSMIGMIVLAPLIAQWLAPCFDWVYNVLHIDPSVIPASVFSNDMGGAPLAKEVAHNEKLGLLNGLVVSSMMGCTLSYSIPYALGVVKKEVQPDMFFGILCGIVTIPVGGIISGLVYGIGIAPLLMNMLPLVLLSALIACGLLFLRSFTVKVFGFLGIAMRALITVGLLLGIFQFLTGIELIKGLGDIREGADICFNAAVTLSGAFPLMHLVSKILAKPLQWLGKVLKISKESAMGFISSLVTNATTFEMMNDMDSKGVVLNSAFLVSAAFVFGGALAFTMAFDESWIFGMILGKLISGVCAAILAIFVYKRIYDKGEKA